MRVWVRGRSAMLRQREFRDRNRRAGLCTCGRPTRIVASGRTTKTCQVCYEKACRYERHAPTPALAQTMDRPRAVWFRITLDLDPSLVTRCTELAVDHGMPLTQILDDALELYLTTVAADA